jgi:hypothetical protein
MINLFQQSLYVNPGRLQDQLAQEIPDEREAAFLASMAAAVDAALISNPVIAALLNQQTAFGVAGLFAHMRGMIVAGIDNPQTEPDMRAKLQDLLTRVDQIVRLGQSKSPEADAADEAVDALTNPEPEVIEL